jgi:ATP-dependent protease ClpP protease subunit
MKSQFTPKRIFSAAKKNDTLELLVYDSIGESWWGDGVTAKSVKAQLDAAGDVSKIIVRLNSPGGDVFEGSAIYSLLTQHKAEVECYVDGLAASAAFTIAMAGSKIHVSEAGMMMCHNALGMSMGYASDMRAMADLLDKVSGTMRDIYCSKSGKSSEDMQALMDAETWFTPQECVDNGFADDVIKREGDEEENAKALAASFDLSKFAHAPEQLRQVIPPPPKADAAATEPEEESGEAKPNADAACQCDCEECREGDCANCSNPNCDDPNCEGSEEEGEQMSGLQEIELMRQQIDIAGA